MLPKLDALTGEPIACSNCGTALTPRYMPAAITGAPPFCTACAAMRLRWLRANSPEYNEHNNELRRQRRAAARKARLATIGVTRDAVACKGCGRVFPKGTLVNGTCGGWWCSPPKPTPIHKRTGARGSGETR